MVYFGLSSYGHTAVFIVTTSELKLHNLPIVVIL